MNLFTSEQVSEGHPDKLCDRISDAILTECLKNDEKSRVACETLIKDFDIVVAGEITSSYDPDYEKIVRDALTVVGLDNVDQYKIQVLVSKQSPDIAMGVDNEGAGDQGMMFGYATNETPEMLPIPYALANRALELLRDSKNPMLLQDAKAQVTYDYDTNKIITFLISTQHKAEYDVVDFKDAIVEIMHTAAKEYGLNTDFNVLVNPTGRFVVGSSFGDCGLTGRKIIADTYGGMCRHGGGAFSGKDPSKVDRSAAYMMRKVAKDLVRSGKCSRCEVQVAYAIGVKEPLSVRVDSFGTGKVSDEALAEEVRNKYDLTPQGIIKNLDLLHVDYNRVSAYGHFGKKGLPWEE